MYFLHTFYTDFDKILISNYKNIEFKYDILVNRQQLYDIKVQKNKKICGTCERRTPQHFIPTDHRESNLAEFSKNL